MVTLVAVSKSQPPEAIRAAYDAGCRDFGESYVQEALPKLDALRGLEATWHYIGHLQGNKAKDVAQHFDWVHGIDRIRIAGLLGKARPASAPRLKVCVQVNVSAEATKGGVPASQALGLAREVAATPGLELRGLMGMASDTDDVASQREQFASLRRAYDELAAAGLAVDTLSMGMSHDFEAAVAEGATLVRIGTAIFGSRGFAGARK